MSIAKKPKSNTFDTSLRHNKKAEDFIAGTDSVMDNPRRQNKQPILIRFDQDLLRKVDEAAMRRGVSRSAWLQYVVSRAMDHGEG